MSLCIPSTVFFCLFFCGATGMWCHIPVCIPIKCMHSRRVCAPPRCAHACASLAWEQCVMTPAAQWCVKRCNVCARRRCQQHHRPLSWPGLLTQRFLSQLIGPDTNFLAELQCGRANLITRTSPFSQLL